MLLSSNERLVESTSGDHVALVTGAFVIPLAFRR